MSYLSCIFLRAGLIALPILLTACTKTIHYEEEVQLSTGATIVLQRSVKGERFGELGAGGGKLIEQRLEFAIDDKQYVWADDIPPLAIDIYKDSLFIAAMPHTIGACLSHGSPSPPFVFYRHTDKGWAKIPKEQFPDSIRVNLLYFGDGYVGKVSERVTLARKRKISEALKTNKMVQSLYRLKDSPDRCRS